MWHWRWLIERDTEEVLALEQAGAANPWSADDLIRWRRERKVMMIVAEDSLRGQIGGYAVYHLHERFFQLIRLVTHRDRRRQGVASHLISQLKRKLSDFRRTAIVGVAPESRLDVQLFLRRQGFQAVQIVHNWCSETGQDGYLMQYRLAGTVTAVACGTNRIAALEF